ncbi:MAG: hypothetical protein CV087_17470 [Candidatus Brocadia sp. WS118]|nr:MAG: hypothetical protein CV087_17470 [Candidatus Brocadia sp. WS118]
MTTEEKKQFRGVKGRYDFSNMEAFCTCGHKLGIHCAPNETGIRDCMHSDCQCKQFVSTPPETGRELEDQKKIILKNCYSWIEKFGKESATEELEVHLKSLLLSEHRRWQAELRKKVERMEGYILMLNQGVFEKSKDGGLLKRSDVLSMLEEGK